ncbi:A/G-specific adenine glycosylase [Hoyosella sp. YIM 151337]|uniref:A/G-specific adenine glycosylase n=1 Tax=Hoyosella sp. YIM 151337 TaxID=2992742 RepID=UPI002235D195|nr:A/G-specific adenine glycosylase [Hoyosella sp. YIM 151337]MCW4352794.1 A/G-specific adenine glycosylase [Hoyosella sp. YIM 151337]
MIASTEDVVTWFQRNARDLPWRRPGVTPWQILMSEIMLQQTPVVRVSPVWEEWVQRWPRPSLLAAEAPATVVRAWGKLGYPRRALRLHECAVHLAAAHSDEVPRDVETLLTLPGIGDYTARAVACFAYGQSVPVVDTNVRRVIARAVHGQAESGNPAAKRDLEDAAALLPHSGGAVFSAALMELGAVICTARAPKCPDCPITSCAWLTAGRPAPTGPKRRAQPYAGTDRQVRGRILDVLRGAHGPVERHQIEAVWLSDPVQRDRALVSLLEDGLVEQTSRGRFALAGEGE